MGSDDQPMPSTIGRSFVVVAGAHVGDGIGQFIGVSRTDDFPELFFKRVLVDHAFSSLSGSL